MITTNVIQRTFHIKVGEQSGTCFAADVDGKQYLITAKHLVEDLIGTNFILINHEKQWKAVETTLVGHCDGDIDISVLAPDVQLAPTYELTLTAGEIIYGQDVYFLGFPYGMTGESVPINFEFPFPFVKKAIVSNLYFCNDELHTIFLDGHNNPGFSGGPVVFSRPNSIEYKVAAVISAYRYEIEPVYMDSKQSPFTYRYNTGIIVAHGIRHVFGLIDSNPIGIEIG